MSNINFLNIHVQQLLTNFHKSVPILQASLKRERWLLSAKKKRFIPIHFQIIPDQKDNTSRLPARKEAWGWTAAYTRTGIPGTSCGHFCRPSHAGFRLLPLPSWPMPGKWNLQLSVPFGERQCSWATVDHLHFRSLPSEHLPPIIHPRRHLDAQAHSLYTIPRNLVIYILRLGFSFVLYQDEEQVVSGTWKLLNLLWLSPAVLFFWQYYPTLHSLAFAIHHFHLHILTSTCLSNLTLHFSFPSARQSHHTSLLSHFPKLNYVRHSAKSFLKLSSPAR